MTAGGLRLALPSSNRRCGFPASGSPENSRTGGAYEWNDYANTLLKSEIESLRQPAKALELDLRATRATKESNALFFDTLAWAYFRNADAPTAIRTGRQALNLVPAGNALGQGLRSELEQGLAQFETTRKE